MTVTLIWQQPYEPVWKRALFFYKEACCCRPIWALHTQHQQVWEEIFPPPPSPCRRMWAGSVCGLMWGNKSCWQRALSEQDFLAQRRKREGSLDAAGCAEANYTGWWTERVDSGEDEPGTACFQDEEESSVLTLFFQKLSAYCTFSKMHNGCRGKKILHLPRNPLECDLNQRKR